MKGKYQIKHILLNISNSIKNIRVWKFNFNHKYIPIPIEHQMEFKYFLMFIFKFQILFKKVETQFSLRSTQILHAIHWRLLIILHLTICREYKYKYEDLIVVITELIKLWLYPWWLENILSLSSVICDIRHGHCMSMSDKL